MFTLDIYYLMNPEEFKTLIDATYHNQQLLIKQLLLKYKLEMAIPPRK